MKEITVTFENGGVFNGSENSFTLDNIITYYFAIDKNYRVQVNADTMAIELQEYQNTNGAWYGIDIITAVSVQEVQGGDVTKEYLEELGVEDSGIDKMIKSVYELLNLITFITAGEKEVHAWTITKGTKAPQAAGVIHTDFEKGFIRAEVTAYKDFAENGSYAACKDKGVTRLEGKDYVMQDGDIVHFRFAV